LNLALSIYRYFPHGGLQRDFRQVLERLQQRGHRCRVYTGQWQGERPAGIDLQLVPVRAFSNHGRDANFQRWVARDLQARPVDGHIGFNRMPGLDVCFVGDTCFAARPATGLTARLATMGARYRHHVASERAVFAPQAGPDILLLNDLQMQAYAAQYGTPAQRMHLLPPGVNPQRRAPEDAAPRREKMRASLGLAGGEYVWLFVGSQFHTKGLDRALNALAAAAQQQPATNFRLLVVGAGKVRGYQRQAKKLGVLDKVQFLGAREDILDLMLAADLLLHAPRREAGGTVLLEAIAAGLPIVTTANCGYASHVVAARCGRVLAEPFDPQALVSGVLRFIDGVLRADCREAALLYARHTDLYSMHERAAELIEQCVAARSGLELG